ncbi:YhdB family protein [Aquibacillus sp. 3ASR75-11]|uniref:YhdB family protein n=1 Tax=Terrihalobacillus insolitus TaxID=2950438 RepID=A0A9X4ALV3_9BACI|nr:YhdB family protein [Terrihalobacillus insolitus]MDC3413597.1 YhdB family protein [Terrihalobacillus insolitus]MDC3424646.1 YhdB family protein [Terrihalobacillus insolitus]
MYIPDYDKALYFTLWGQWDDLLILMVRTNDDLLSKKIEVFLHSFHYKNDEQAVMHAHEELLQYIDHAMAYTPVATMEV